MIRPLLVYLSQSLFEAHCTEILTARASALQLRLSPFTLLWKQRALHAARALD